VNDSYTFYTNGTSYFNGKVTHAGDLEFVAITAPEEGSSSVLSKKITWSGGSDAVDLYYELPASEQGNLVFNTRDDTNCLLAFAYKGTHKAYINPSTPSFYP